MKNGGGHFAPKLGGQFELESGGHFKLELGGQYHWNLHLDKDLLVWFGHSSYFIQIDGKRILVDPVFSGNASPIPGTVKAFNGTDIYTVADLPEIDYLFISHDH